MTDFIRAISRFSILLLSLAGLLLFALAFLLLTAPGLLLAILPTAIALACLAAALCIAASLLRILFAKK